MLLWQCHLDTPGHSRVRFDCDSSEERVETFKRKPASMIARDRRRAEQYRSKISGPPRQDVNPSKLWSHWITGS